MKQLLHMNMHFGSVLKNRDFFQHHSWKGKQHTDRYQPTLNIQQVEF